MSRNSSTSLASEGLARIRNPTCQILDEPSHQWCGPHLLLEELIGRYVDRHFAWLRIDEVGERENSPVDDPDNDRDHGQKAEQARHVLVARRINLEFIGIGLVVRF